MDKNNKTGLFRNFTSFFYALAITIGIYISIQELQMYNNVSNFVIFSFAILAIYCVELFTTYQSKSSKVEINFDIEDEVNEITHLFHKLILPIILYFSIITFGYYNFNSKNLFIILIITFFSFFILFINTKAFLLDLRVIEHRTHYVYDIIKFLVFFLLVNSIDNYFVSSGGNLIVLSIIVGILSFIILILMVWRINKLRKKSALYSAMAAVLLGIMFGIFNIFLSINALQLSLSLIFLFYISTAIIHHKLMGTLTFSVISEYLVVILLVLAITYGIT